eukprot:CAMPEP_0185851542 /NCGR_PEP_ID=MMETSP1354-20130828/10286_1 /TAXON_ID=708628 /ORGANISM="Erythrolobus madagascarensis, Strain CCMP3276" /LENGTH=368 /DNA_ID=CAMNT_0028552551 /DNA_START=95 /DNA_END=1201 /DNA_ORIENTATION=+
MEHPSVVSPLVPRTVLAVSVFLSSLLVHVVTCLKDSESVLAIDLARPVTSHDERVAIWVRVFNLCAGGVAACAVLFSTKPSLMYSAFLLGITLQVAALLAASFYLARTRSDQASLSSSRWVESESPSIVHIISARLHVVHAAVILSCVGVFVWLAPRLPARVPLHWDMSGQADRHGNPRDLWVFFKVIIMNTALLMLVLWAIAKERWVISDDQSSENNTRAQELQLARRQVLARMMERTIVGVDVGLCVLWIGLAVSVSQVVELPVGAVVLVGSLLVLSLSYIPVLVGLPEVRRIQSELTPILGDSAAGTDSSGWKWGGMVYYAPNDPAIVVPKRVGIGQTLNMARPASWLIFAGLPVLIVLWFQFDI